MKKLLLILFFCVIYFKVVAQTNTEVNPVRHAVHYGFKFGLNYSNMNFNKGYPTPTTPVASSWRPGFLLGFLLEVPLPYNFSLQQEYLYSQTNGEHQSLNTKYNHSYLSLPLMLKYRILPKVVIMVGPQFELLIAAKEETNGQTINTTHETEERSIGLSGGLGFRVSKFLSFNARFMHGFNHIGITQRTNALEYKYESVQITTDFRF
ncbi:porin family protein [Adhaeribacter radiodurans]|uniref:PorT family protein n=1 Tax=Adhaeribacter radiodurans TaxID=2745197 RepID=A0A7L7L5K8_9BACT|nr:porin family protein [Adhaeribacter radiodurans]QMU28088.1 PorT family protein [Adhaeribacter radiodurans]